MNHPHIVTIYEIGQDRVRSADGSAEPDSSPLHFISMELVSGKTLAAKIHQEKTDLKTLLGWLAQAAEGLSKAHAAGIVHRDLKPGNIMISQDGYAKVLDFGLAKLTERQVAGPDLTSAPTRTEEGTSEGAVLGTVGYMAPEQVQGKLVDHRSDVFSFGAILYEAATRRRPFAAESNVETMHQILHQVPAPIEELNPEAPTELRRLIRRCLAKDPNQRLQSMKDLAIELREIVEEYDALSASASSGGTAASAPLPGRRRRLVTPVLIAAGLAVFVVAISLWMVRRSIRGSAANADTQITTVTSRGDVSDAALSPDGRYLAYASGPPNQNSLWVRQLQTETEAQIIPPQDRPMSGLSFSSDGNYVFYGQADLVRTDYQGLFQIASLGGKPRRRAFDVDSPVGVATDGKRICFVRHQIGKAQDALIVLDLETGTEKTVATVTWPDRLLDFRPAWSPDGARIAAIELFAARATRGPRFQVVLFGTSDGRRQIIGPDSLYIGDIAWLPDARGMLLAANRRSGEEPTQIWFLEYPSGRTSRITNDLASFRSVSLSADGSTIAAVHGTRFANLWVAEVSGNGTRQLTFATSEGKAPVVIMVPRDTSIFFLTGPDQRTMKRIEPDGSGERTILSDALHGSYFSSLPDGGIVYSKFQADGVAHLWRADGDGENTRQLLSLPGGEIPVDVSRDGRTLLFYPRAQIEELWALRLGGGQPVRIAASTWGSVLARFSPDGSRVLYQRRREVNGKAQGTWYEVSSEGGAPLDSLTPPPNVSDVEWAPDGRSLTCLNAGLGVANVCYLRPGTSVLEPITRFSEGGVVDSEWSPDGSRLLMTRRFVSGESVWTADARGGNATPLKPFEGGRVSYLAWLPDSRRALIGYGRESSDVAVIRNFR